LSAADVVDDSNTRNDHRSFEQSAIADPQRFAGRYWYSLLLQSSSKGRVELVLDPQRRCLDVQAITAMGIIAGRRKHRDYRL